MYLAIIDDHNQIKIARTSDDLEISELLNFFYVYKVEGQIPPDQVHKKKNIISSNSRRMKSRKRFQIWMQTKLVDQIKLVTPS